MPSPQEVLDALRDLQDQKMAPSWKAIVQTAIGEIESLSAERDALREKLERLGSMEAMTHSQIIRHTFIDGELRARIQYARDALGDTHQQQTSEPEP